MHHIVQAGGLDQTLHGSDFAGYGGGGGSDLLFAVCQSLVSDWYVVDWSHCLIGLGYDDQVRGRRQYVQDTTAFHLQWGTWGRD